MFFYSSLSRLAIQQINSWRSLNNSTRSLNNPKFIGGGKVGGDSCLGWLIHTALRCGKGGSTAVRKHGSRKGQPKYPCTACRQQALFAAAAFSKAQAYAQVATLLPERVSQRAIRRLTGISGSTIGKLAKKAAAIT